MTRPTRWRDQGPDEVRELLRHAPKTRALAPEDRARTRARVARLGGIAAVAGGLTLMQSAALGAGLAVLTLITFEVGSSFLSSTQPPAPSPSPARSALVLAPAPLASTAPSSAPPFSPPPSPVDSPPLRSGARRPEAPSLVEEEPPAPPPARAADTLAEEAALIERARVALASSPGEALARTEEHAAQFPAGKLGMERELVAIDALGRLGRRAEARARAESLLARARGGLYEERLRQLLDGLR